MFSIFLYVFFFNSYFLGNVKKKDKDVFEGYLKVGVFILKSGKELIASSQGNEIFTNPSPFMIKLS